MDQIKIGKFIAERRKRMGLTQAELAEALGLTDRAVSKWETGRSLPDPAIMLALCEILKINVTDLLCGEVVTVENYNEQMEKRLLEMVEEKRRSDKQLLTLEVVLGVLSCLVLMIPVFLGAFLPIASDLVRILIVFSGVIPAFVGIFFAVRIEQIAGYYECAECGHRYVPTYKAVNLSMHVGRTRKMVCPKCGKRSWQKKVLDKQ